MERLMIEQYATYIMDKAAKRLQTLETVQLMEMKLMPEITIGDRLKIAGKFIPWYILYRVFKDDENIDDKIIDIAYEKIIEDDKYEDMVINACKIYTEDTVQELNAKYVKMLTKENLTVKQLTTIADDMKLL